MKYNLILCCIIFCSCVSLKKNKLELTKDSLLVSDMSQQFKLESVMEMQQLITQLREEQQVVEIYSERPYRLHPDSGLMAGAGYLRMRLKGKEWIQKQAMSAQQNHLSSGRQQRSEEKLQVKQALKTKWLEKATVPYMGYVMLFAGMALLFIIYKVLKVSPWR